MKAQEQKNMKASEYKNDIKQKMHLFVRSVYRLSRSFPKTEIYGVVSQLRRAALSIILNYIEGFARRRPAVHLSFLEISYGSLKEVKYLLYFAYEEGWLKRDDYVLVLKRAEEIGAILWTEIVALENNLKK